jgi:HEPN domain-containing protein
MGTRTSWDRVRREAELWWKQSLEDLKSAEGNLGIGRYYLVAFLCHQAIEKALKALYIQKLRESPGATHSLIFLGGKVGVPKQLFGHLRKVSPDFVVARYPNAAQGLPHEIYDREMAEERLRLAREVLGWVKKALEG